MASVSEEDIERLRVENPAAFHAIHRAGFESGMQLLEKAAAELRDQTAAYVDDVRERILAAERTRCAVIVALGSQHTATAGAITDAIRDGLNPVEFLARLGIERPTVAPERLN